MTLSAGQVSLGVHPDTKGFGAKLHEGVMAESGGLFGIGKELGGHLMEGLATIGIAVGVGEFIKKGVEEYSAADALNAQFAAGIKSTNNAAGLSVKSMDELAASVSGYSGQAYDSIGKTEQVLQTFTNIKNVGPDKIFDDTTVAAANMAAKLGGDASSQAIQLGKALNDPVKGMTALRRVGVAFTADQAAQVDAMVKSGDVMGAQKVILGELNTEFGGAAKAAGQTLPGEIARSKVAFGELTKAVMTGVMPFVTPMIGGIADAMNKATPFIEHFGEIFQEKLAKVGEALHSLSELVLKGEFTTAFREAFHVEEDSPIVGMLLKVHDALKEGEGGVRAFFAAFKAGGDDVTSSGFAGVLESAGLSARKLFDAIGPALKGAFDQLKGPLGAIIPQIVSLAVAFSPLHIILTALGPVLPILAKAVTSLATTLLTGLATALLAVLPTLTQMTSAIVTGLVPAITGLVHWISQNMDLVKTLGVMVLGAVVALKAYEMIMGVVKIATGAWAAIQGVLNVVMDANPMTLIIIAIGALVAGIIWVATQTHFFQDVWKVMTDVIGAAWNWLWNSVISPVVNFIVSYFQMLGSVAAWLWNNAIQPAINGIGDAFNWIWNSIISPIGQWIGGAIQNIGDTVGRVFGGIGGTIRGAFDGIVGFIRGVINSVIDVVNGAAAGINGFIDLADKVPGVSLPHVGTIPHLATGGTIRTPGTALVGENGPEVVSLPAGATVYPTGTGPSSTSGGTTFNIYEAHNATATAQTVMQRITARKV